MPRVKAASAAARGTSKAVVATRAATSAKAKRTNGGDLGFEATLWAVDTLRGSMDASEYKHPVLGLIFLKYISDAFEELYAQLARDPESDPEDRDEYAARNVYWVPPAAPWSQIAGKRKEVRRMRHVGGCPRHSSKADETRNLTRVFIA